MQVIYSSLKQLLEHQGNVAEDFMTTYTVTRQSVFGETVVVPLVDGGADIIVDKHNRKVR